MSPVFLKQTLKTGCNLELTVTQKRVSGQEFLGSHVAAFQARSFIASLVGKGVPVNDKAVNWTYFRFYEGSCNRFTWL